MDFNKITQTIAHVAVGINLIKSKSDIDKFVYRKLCGTVYTKQAKQIRSGLFGLLTSFFREQLKSASDRFAELHSVKNTDLSGTVSSIFDPREWDNKLIDTALPFVAKGMIESMILQVQLLQPFVSKSEKASTATEWLQQNQDTPLNEVVFSVAGHLVSMELATEFPRWMKDSIEAQLRGAFSQEYWLAINDLTSKDLEAFLSRAIKDGWSIRRMVQEMSDSILDGDDYSKMRARRIAITESANALNGARSDAIDGVIEDAGMGEFIKKMWMSVLIPTTRTDHANLDGVPADKNNQWLVGGEVARWPGDYLLSAEQRCNCLCTLVSEFGVTDSDAAQLIEDYYQRIEGET